MESSHGFPTPAPIPRCRSPFAHVFVALVALLLVSLVAMTPAAAQEAESAVVPSDGGVDVYARDTRIVDLFQQLAEQTGRSIVISPAIGESRVTVTLRHLTLTEVFDAVLPPIGGAYVDYGKYLVVDTAANLAAQQVKPESRVVEVIKLRYTSAKDMVAMITPLVGTGGKVIASPESETGIDSASKETGGHSMASGDVLIVEDTADRVAEIKKVIESIDVQPAQVVVEATILRAALTDDNQLGIDFNFLGGVDFEGINATSTGGTNLVPGQVPQRQFEDGIAAISSIFSTPFTGNGITFGLIKNNIGFFIRALEELTDTVVLANPKILALNKQRGEVIVGRRDGFVTTTVTETAAVQSVEFLETGTQLTFRPFVLDDKHVRMEIHVEDSAGGLNPSDLPFETTTESTSNIFVQDGHTILIGGLFRDRTEATRSQTPGVGEIPGFGALFRQSKDQSQREEVIVLLTVHIVGEDPDYQEMSREMLDEADAILFGVRERVQWFGRRKLAESHVTSAIELMNRGRFDQALFHARLALASDPLSTVARRLRNQLVSEKPTIEPNLELRNWVARQLNERPRIDKVTDQVIDEPMHLEPTRGPKVSPPESSPKPNDANEGPPNGNTNDPGE